MAFTHVWTDSIPPIGQNANQIGVDFRDSRLDIHERMDAALVKDWTADPLEPQDLLIGKADDLVKIIPFCSFLNDLNSKENDIGDGSLNGFVGSDPLVAPVFIPV